MTEHLDNLEDYESTASGIHEAIEEIEEAIAETTDYLLHHNKE